MQETYRHTQVGRMLRWAMVPGPLVLATVGALTGKLALLGALAIVLGGVGLLFSTLTIEVTETQLVWYFGPGLWRKSVARELIASATPETNKWWWGWGIHRTPRGWLYNVAGLEAVEVTMRDGKRFRLGSDESVILAQILNRGR